jgi:hypothetical protein
MQLSDGYGSAVVWRGIPSEDQARAITGRSLVHERASALACRRTATIGPYK